MTTAEGLQSLLKKRYPPPEWVFFEELSSGTGSFAHRRADALIMNLWPSRGLTVQGFEVKVSRSDWRRELAQPTKSAPIQKFCDYWWVVAPKGIVPHDQLPETWGLIELKGKRLVQVKAAPKLEAEELNRSFVASLLRNASTQQAAADARDERYINGLRDGRQLARDEYEYERKASRSESSEKGELLRLQRTVQEFEDASRTKLSTYNGGDIGRLVRVMHEFRFATDPTATMKAAKAPLERALSALNQLEKAIDSSKDET